jgi:hypothetical protein
MHVACVVDRQSSSALLRSFVFARFLLGGPSPFGLPRKITRCDSRVARSRIVWCDSLAGWVGIVTAAKVVLAVQSLVSLVTLSLPLDHSIDHIPPLLLL